MADLATCKHCGRPEADHVNQHDFGTEARAWCDETGRSVFTPIVPQSEAPCYCRPADPADPCGHSDSSQGCPRHDRQAYQDWLAEEQHWADEEATGEPTCSICDAVGHGYPGGGPCPLEMRGRCECGGIPALDGFGCLCGGS